LLHQIPATTLKLHKFWVFQKLMEAVKKLKNLPYS